MTSKKKDIHESHEDAIPKDRAKSANKKASRVRMPFSPKIYYYFNCFRKYRPPTRVWETVSRAEWSSAAA